jgi:phosphinothricin acetyltransferase
MNAPASPTIRMATSADAQAVAAIYAPYVLETAISFELDPPSVEEMRSRIEDVLDRHVWLIASMSGETIGYAYAGQHRSRLAYRFSIDVAVYLSRSARRQGIGGRLYLALLQIARRQGYANAYAGITEPNAASVGFHRAMGFEPIGIYRDVGYKLGRWWDVSWWGRRFAPIADPPAEPVRVRDLDPVWLNEILAAR